MGCFVSAAGDGVWVEAMRANMHALPYGQAFLLYRMQWAGGGRMVHKVWKFHMGGGGGGEGGLVRGSCGCSCLVG